MQWCSRAGWRKIFFLGLFVAASAGLVYDTRHATNYRDTFDYEWPGSSTTRKLIDFMTEFLHGNSESQGKSVRYRTTLWIYRQIHWFHPRLNRTNHFFRIEEKKKNRVRTGCRYASSARYTQLASSLGMLNWITSRLHIFRGRVIVYCLYERYACLGALIRASRSIVLAPDNYGQGYRVDELIFNNFSERSYGPMVWLIEVKVWLETQRFQVWMISLTLI